MPDKRAGAVWTIFDRPLGNAHGWAASNVRDADATLIIFMGEPTGGTALTVNFCKQLNKPFMVCAPDIVEINCVQSWLENIRAGTVNVAGPRERLSAPIYKKTKAWLDQLFSN